MASTVAGEATAHAGPGGPRPGRTARPPWPRQRRPGDLLRVALALPLVVAAAWAAHRAAPTVVEVNIFRLVNQLPTPVGAPLLGVMQTGALLAVPAFALIAVLAGRRRLAGMVLCGGTAAWGLAKMGQWLVDEDPPTLRLSRVVLHGMAHPGTSFPSTHVAVAAGLATVAGPYLTRPARRLGWLITAIVAAARVYVGLHLPVDVVGGLALGWGAGAAVNFLLGVPAPGPSAQQVAAVLAELGRPARTLEPQAPSGDRFRFRCRMEAGGDILVKTADQAAIADDWLWRLWRLVAFRELPEPVFGTTPAERSEHEAYVQLLAEQAGVRTPPLVATRSLGAQAALVMRGWVDASPLEPPVADGVVRDAWEQLALAHKGGVVHGGLLAAHVLADQANQVWLVEWGHGRASSDLTEQAADVADLAVTLALAAPPHAVVAAAADVMPHEVLAEAVHHLQPLALAEPVRRQLAERSGLLDQLRDELGRATGTRVPAALSPARVAGRNLLPVAAVGLAVYILLPRLAQATSTAATFRSADWPWLGLVALAATTTYVMAALAMMAAAGVPLAFGRTFVVQLAASFTNRLVPAGLGAAATNVRYLELAGMDRSSATSTVALTSAAGFVVHAGGVAAAALLVGSRFNVPRLPDFDASWPALVALGAISTAVGWLIWLRGVHRQASRWLRAGFGNLGALLRRPDRLLGLLAANAGVTLAFVLALDAALAAFRVHLPVTSVAAVYLGGSAVAAAAPTPGGVGPFEAAVVAGLGALRVPAAQAVAATLAFRLITYWLPVAPGAAALHRLRRSGTL